MLLFSLRATAQVAALAVLMLGGSATGLHAAPAKPLSYQAKRTLEEADSLRFQAAALEHDSHHVEAIAVAERVVRMREKVLGPDHEDVAASLNDLAALYRAKTGDTRAEPVYARILAITERTFGADSPAVAKSASDFGALYRDRGDYIRAEPLYARALRIMEHARGPDDLYVASSLSNLAWVYRAKKDYARARPLYERALRITETSAGSAPAAWELLEVAQSLLDLAELCREQGDYSRAEPLYGRALRIKQKVFVIDAPEVLTILNALAALYSGTNRSARAEELYEHVLRARENAVGPKDVELADALTNLAGAYRRKGDYARAEPLFLRALEIEEKLGSSEQRSVGAILNDLGLLYRQKGDYERAGPMYERAARISENALGPDAPDVATTLNNLAALYRAMGEYGRAEPLQERGLRIREKALGADHPDVAESLNDLASLYVARGDYSRAEPLFERSLRIRESALGPYHQDVARTLNDMGILFMTKRDYARAQLLEERALRLTEQALGPDHPTVGTSLHNVGEVYIAKGDYASAVPLLERALRIAEKTFGLDHPTVASALSGLARLYWAMGDIERAQRLFERALRIDEKALGPAHPDVAAAMSNLAVLLWAKGDVKHALDLEERAKELQELTLASVLGASADPQKRAFFATLRADTDSMLSLHIQFAPQSDRAARLALSTLLRRKGRVLDSGANMMRGLRANARVEDQPLLDKLRTTRSELARGTLAGPGPRETTIEHATHLGSLREESRAIEEDLSRRYAALRAVDRAITIDGVQETLGEGQALVELAAYRPFHPKNAPYAVAGEGVSETSKARARWEEMHYVAYVLTRTSAPRHVDLGPATPIDRSVAQVRAALASASPSYVALGRQLDQLVMAKVRPLLRNATDVFLASDGVLGMIPFGALVDEKNRFRTETMRFTYLTSGRDLLRLQDVVAPREASLVLAAPDYNLVAEATTSAQPAARPELRASARRSIDFAKVRFLALPGTAAEATALSRILPDATVLTGAEATKEVLAAAHGPKLLHIATHGFFLEDVALPAGADGRGLQLITEAQEPRVALSEDPLLRAGLALAGANHRVLGEDDGVLTALEATSLDLWGTKLVTLSACETGVGEVKNGDGIYGLRRALVLAGAETEMMSLWKVDDRATEQLMTRYYGKLLQGGGRSDALREVQLEMMNDPATAHPFYWASFIVSGDQRTLDGNAAPAVRVVADRRPSSVEPGSRGCGCSVPGQREGSWPEGSTLAACVIAAAVVSALRRRAS